MEENSLKSRQSSLRMKGQKLYEAGEKLEVVAAECGVHPVTIRRWAKKFKWVRASNKALTARWTRRLPALKTALRIECCKI